MKNCALIAKGKTYGAICAIFFSSQSSWVGVGKGQSEKIQEKINAGQSILLNSQMVWSYTEGMV